MWGLAQVVTHQRGAFLFESHSLTHPAEPCDASQWQ